MSNVVDNISGIIMAFILSCVVGTSGLMRTGMTPFKQKCLFEGRVTSPGPTSLAATTDNPSPFLITPLFRKKRFIASIPLQNGTPAPRLEEVQDRSTCSWRMINHYDSTRIPNMMPKAVCNDANGVCNHSFLRAYRSTNEEYYDYFLGLLQTYTECAIVYELKTIYREHCDQGRYSCTPEEVQWPVACTCALKRVRTVTPQTQQHMQNTN